MRTAGPYRHTSALRIMLVMTRPSPSLSRYTLLTMPEARHLDASSRRVRRYRLARVQVGGRPGPVDRFPQLHRGYE